MNIKKGFRKGLTSLLIGLSLLQPVKSGNAQNYPQNFKNSSYSEVIESQNQKGSPPVFYDMKSGKISDDTSTDIQKLSQYQQSEKMSLKDLKKNAKDKSVELMRDTMVGMVSPYHLDVRGKENIPKGGGVLAANHSSYLDAFFLLKGTGKKINFVSCPVDKKPEVGRGIYNNFLKYADQIVNNNEGIKGEVLNKATNVLSSNQGSLVGVFPERSRTRTGKIGAIYEDAAVIAYEAHKPVIPTGLRGVYGIWSPNAKLPKLNGDVILNFGKPLYVNYSLQKDEAIKDLTIRYENAIKDLSSGGLHGNTRLEKIVEGTSVFLLASSLFFLLPGITGNVIGDLTLKNSNLFGLGLFIAGLIGALLCFKKK